MGASGAVERGRGCGRCGGCGVGPDVDGWFLMLGALVKLGIAAVVLSFVAAAAWVRFGASL